jgi:hypothetical protein
MDSAYMLTHDTLTNYDFPFGNNWSRYMRKTISNPQNPSCLQSPFLMMLSGRALFEEASYVSIRLLLKQKPYTATERQNGI